MGGYSFLCFPTFLHRDKEHLRNCSSVPSSKKKPLRSASSAVKVSVKVRWNLPGPGLSGCGKIAHVKQCLLPVVRNPGLFLQMHRSSELWTFVPFASSIMKPQKASDKSAPWYFLKELMGQLPHKNKNKAKQNKT